MSEHSGLVVLADRPAAVGACKGLRAIDCVKCGFVHLDPLPTQAALDKLYSQEYYQHHHADLFRKEKREQWYWRLVYRERLQEFGQAIDKRVINLLDYGAGFGWFVRCAERYNWERYGRNGQIFDAWGYELGAVGINRCSTDKVFSDIPVWACDALRLCLTGEVLPDIPAGTYDAVHLSFVLEHIRDPLAMLREIHGLLAPGGVLCIVVPNEFNKLQQRLRGRGYTPLHPHHLNYFSPDTLRWLAERVGFEVLRTTATFPMEALALAGLDYTRWGWAGTAAHWLRMIFEAALLLVAPKFKRRLFEWFARKDIGREIELWLQKK